MKALKIAVLSTALAITPAAFAQVADEPATEAEAEASVEMVEEATPETTEDHSDHVADQADPELTAL
jgi:hypothetical protein